MRIVDLRARRTPDISPDISRNSLLRAIETRTGIGGLEHLQVADSAEDLLRAVVSGYVSIAVTDTVSPGILRTPRELYVLRSEYTMDARGLSDPELFIVRPVSRMSGDGLDMSDLLYLIGKEYPRSDILLDLSDASEYLDLTVPEEIPRERIRAVLLDTADGSGVLAGRDSFSRQSVSQERIRALESELAGNSRPATRTLLATEGAQVIRDAFPDRVLPDIHLRIPGRCLLRSPLPARIAGEVLRANGVLTEGPYSEGPEVPDLYTLRNYGENLVALQVGRVPVPEDIRALSRALQDLDDRCEDIREILGRCSKLLHSNAVIS